MQVGDEAVAFKVLDVTCLLHDHTPVLVTQLFGKLLEVIELTVCHSSLAALITPLVNDLVPVHAIVLTEVLGQVVQVLGLSTPLNACMALITLISLGYSWSMMIQLNLPQS